MFSKVNVPASLLAEELDDYLEKGWFRMGQSVFTTNFLTFKNEYFSALWLRADLDEYEEDSTFKKLKKLNAKFRVEYQKAIVSAEKKALFAQYRQSVAFDASDSIEQLLFSRSTSETSIYNTYEVNLFDDQKLIGVGYFDIGNNTAAGISSFYDPAFKKFSLGKYIIYLKLDFCKNQGLKYFYPGYYVPGYSAFDYKLTIGNSSLHFLSLKYNKWLPINQFSPEYNIYPLVVTKLKSLQLHLDKEQMSSTLLNYDFFQANMVPELTKFELFDYPVFLLCTDFDNAVIGPIIVFDIFDDNFKLLQCRSVWKTNEMEDKKAVYSEHLLKTEHSLFETTAENEMVNFLSGKYINS